MMRLLFVSIFLLLFSVAQAETDSKFYWPEPDQPNTETDPFIEPVKTAEENSESTKMRESPLEDDPLMRTPLEEKSLQEGIPLDLPIHETPGNGGDMDGVQPLPGEPEDLAPPLAYLPVKKKPAVKRVQQISWVESANNPNLGFSLVNLPYGVYSSASNPIRKQIGVAIGNQIFNVRRAVEAGLLAHLDFATQRALLAETLNALMALGPDAWHQVRESLSKLLQEKSYFNGNEETFLTPQKEAIMHMPIAIGDYTDFYTSLDHAKNIGKRFRPNNPIMPNFKHLPVGYHGRASSIVVSGTAIHRPKGQAKGAQEESPSYGPTTMLDYEMELGAVVGVGNELGDPISMENTKEHLFGIVILNDWSARDVQKWEYQPLGPFNGKNFASTVSPWVVTMESLREYHEAGPPRSEGDPETLDYLKTIEKEVLPITVEVWLSSKKMREVGEKPIMLSRSNFRSMYWTFPQMLVHHTSTGANMRTGDLLGSGTISGSKEGTKGCLLEICEPGSEGILLSDGTYRKFLEDGDEVIMKAYLDVPGLPKISFGECCGEVFSTR